MGFERSFSSGSASADTSRMRPPSERKSFTRICVRNARFASLDAQTARAVRPSLSISPMFIGIPFTSAVAVPVIVHVSRNRASASCERNAQYSASAASAESRFMSAPPIRYQPQEILSSSPSGGDIRHCPAVPARRSRVRSTPLSVRIHITPPTRNERNRYPLKSPNTRCPASCTRTCA